ncbi:membrane protein [Pokkaliibacter plantistimulans]|uniref:Membrane protein n=2 Tax=Pseudomonadota TaxID=1224 RepID=A0ABX5M3S0_9GAMM|nr:MULTISPECIES: DUF4212 domain-containing protein [Pokkaliibacter]MDH2431272.1 DUF4212 domain-containing protein [Pokkaliibacter sp. MBI-7]PPC78417.1 DUF4212 domain-containing protein [Pokkaliibacter plantistimulans]PXF32363.1 membrane protein [Pokkaliibacter plantistimulans]
MSLDKDKNNARAYWKENVRIILTYLVIWFLASFGCGIIFVEPLNTVQFFGFKLGFWFAQQGSVYIFLILIVAYAISMNKLDEKYDVHE